MNKKQAEKILATAVMGMNLVNTVATLAALATAEQKLSAVPQPVRSEAEPLDYAVLPQLADVVDNLVFARAYATDYSGTANVASMGNGDTQTITANQSGTVSVNNGGTQMVSSGGTGTVSTMGKGWQYINDGGNGTIDTMSGGAQRIFSGGTGTISTMNDATQYINGSGTGTINMMQSGRQTIYSNGAGTISAMNGGSQRIESGAAGTISTMNGGTQIISKGGTGTVSTMSGGNQYIEGTVTVSTMSGGSQNISNGGTGTVSTMLGGYQTIYNGKGTIDVMISGEQTIDSGAAGTINTMSGGSQTINGGTGTISTMSRGNQNISSGTGTINTMSGGFQEIKSGGMGTIGAMEYGYQNISSGGAGTVDTMNSGFQTIDSGGTGTVIAMNGGRQNIYGGGTGTVGTMSDGYQSISSGGTGTVSAMMDAGLQYIFSGGTGTVSTMFGSEQRISSGGTGTISSLLGGTQLVSNGGTALDTVIAGGTQIVSSGGTSLDTLLNSGGTVYQKSGGMISSMVYSGGVQIIENISTGYDGMTLGSGGTNVTMGVISGAQMSGTIINSGGEQLVLNGGTALDTELNGGSLQLSSGGTVKDMTLTSGSLELENINGGSFTVSGTLTANNATVDMTDSSIKRAVPTVAYESLTIDKLSGSGTTFVMDTDLAGEANSDKITITDADAGTHYVQIKDLSKVNGVEVTGAHQQLLITDASGKLTFEGKEFNAGGLWDIDPTLAKGDSLGLNANDWYLTKIAKTANNDTRVLLDSADNSYALWRNTNDSLRSRLGALASGSEQSDGIWARTQAGRFSGDNYEGRYNLYQLGFDQSSDAKSVYGAAVDYGDGNGSYDNGSGKDKLKSFSLYSVWTGDNGAYTNVTARYGMVSTDLESYGDYPDKAEYKQHAYSVSVEYGKRFELEKGFFIEPNAQFTLGRLGSIDYTTDRGANGYIEGMNSAIGRIGFVMGQKIRNGSDIYLKADLLHEFAGERDLRLTSDAGGTNDMLTKHNDYGDTWFELGLGANIKVSKTASIYGEIERGFGGDINKKWSVNGGVRFTF